MPGSQEISLFLRFSQASNVPPFIFLLFFLWRYISFFFFMSSSNRHGQFLVYSLRECGGCCHRQNLEDRKENKMPMTKKKTLRKIHQPKTRKRKIKDASADAISSGNWDFSCRKWPILLLKRRGKS